MNSTAPDKPAADGGTPVIAAPGAYARDLRRLDGTAAAELIRRNPRFIACVEIGSSIGAQLARPCMTQSSSFSMTAMVSAIQTPAATSNVTMAIAMTFISVRWR